MMLNDIVAILQYQVTKKQSSTQICQWKDKANKHLWIIQACIWKKIMLNDCFFQSCWTAFWTEGPHIRLELPFSFDLIADVRLCIFIWIEAQIGLNKPIQIL